MDCPPVLAAANLVLGENGLPCGGCPLGQAIVHTGHLPQECPQFPALLLAVEDVEGQVPLLKVPPPPVGEVKGEASEKLALFIIVIEVNAVVLRVYLCGPGPLG